MMIDYNGVLIIYSDEEVRIARELLQDLAAALAAAPLQQGGGK